MQKTADCWLWNGTLDSKGYGKFWGEGTRFQAHRFSYELHTAAIPKGLCVLHHCDTPRCVRPDHLFLGTRRDNNADKVAKGRQAKGDKIKPHCPASGSRNASAKLTEDDIPAIRRRHAAGESQVSIARSLGVGHTCINDIIRGVKWKHVA